MAEHRTGTRGMTAGARQPWRLGEAGPVALLFAVAAAAWALSAERMAGMDAGPGADLGDLGWFAVSWLVMMAAMMLPAATPMVAAYGSRAVPAGATAAFAAGYLAAWVAAGLVAYAAIEAGRSLDLAFLGWEEGGRSVAAAVIAGGGLYQLTTVKRAFLRRCRERGAFLTNRWRTGRLGAVRMGMEHGGFCVGCCWLLMAAWFALGWMSLTWMVLVAGLIAAERLLPWRRAARLAVAVALVVLGSAVALAPGSVPGFTLPGGAMDMR
jgi:predicted metal-binding membrane protein